MPDLKICIVDDDEDDRYFLREAVSEVIESAQIVECSDGKEFLDFIQQEKPGDALTLVLLDMNMPKINGLAPGLSSYTYFLQAQYGRLR